MSTRGTSHWFPVIIICAIIYVPYVLAHLGHAFIMNLMVTYEKQKIKRHSADKVLHFLKVKAE